jgi:hypothetical protein
MPLNPLIKIFPRTPNAHSNSFKIYSYDLIEFSMKKSFNIQNFCIASPNVLELNPCTPPHQELSKDTKNTI